METNHHRDQEKTVISIKFLVLLLSLVIMQLLIINLSLQKGSSSVEKIKTG